MPLSFLIEFLYCFINIIIKMQPLRSNFGISFIRDVFRWSLSSKNNKYAIETIYFDQQLIQQIMEKLDSIL